MADPFTKRKEEDEGVLINQGSYSGIETRERPNPTRSPSGVVNRIREMLSGVPSPNEVLGGEGTAQFGDKGGRGGPNPEWMQEGSGIPTPSAGHPYGLGERLRTAGADLNPNQADTDGRSAAPPDMATHDILKAVRQSQEDLETVGTFFTFNELVQGENLSPQARMQLEHLQENHVRMLGRINETITNTKDTVDMYDRVFAEGQGQDPSVIEQAKGMLGSAGTSRQTVSTGGPAGADGDPVSSRAENRMSEAVAGIMDETTGQTRGLNIVPGGVEDPGHQARQQQSVEDSMITLRNAVNDTSGLSGGGGGDTITESQESAINQAAEAQLDYLGISDETERMKAEAAFKFAMNAEVVNMVREREDVQANYDQAVSAIQLDSAQTQDQQGLGLSLDPMTESFDATYDFAIDKVENDLGVKIKGFEEQGFAELVQGWTTASDAQKPQLLRATAIGQRLLDEGVDEETLIKHLDGGVEVGNRTFENMRDLENVKKFPAGSNQTGLLLSQGVFNATGDAQVAAEIANSHSAHQIIDMRSQGGRVNYEGGGNLKGLFGLPEDVYKAAGTSWEEVKNDAAAQTEIGMAFILTQYGDPASALQDLIDNGGWNFDGFRRMPELNPQGAGDSPLFNEQGEE